ncbi:probable ATP-dependent RNA helicase DDX46 [Cylas formicarius]|uniref:probable ATP-dependent RNA helicase DDX46 n=1 Tax=Cylas formicarius TaxID=197179 RepID=UPI0029586F85|nr:probable ATP-dependent RNA helicase DDX46 [Cylas formicarius]
MEAVRSPSGGRWSNPPPPGTEFDYYDDASDASSKRREPKSPAHRSRSRSHERKRRNKRRSRSRGSRERRRRSRSKSRRRKRRRSASRSRSRRRHEHRRRKRRTRSYSRSRSDSHPRRRDKDRRSRGRGDRADSDARHLADGDIVKEEDMRLEDEEEEEDEEETNPVPFKNDGTFLEMFKKMQEMEKMKEEPAEAKAEEAKRPIMPPTFGKRRGGKVLKTGVVQKVRTKDDEEEASTSNDAWSIYMKEVRKYKEACCDDDSKTRPLVK